MIRPLARWLCLPLSLSCGAALSARAQELAPITAPAPAADAPSTSLALLPGSDANEQVKPLAEGPVHEAFLSPARDETPEPRREDAAAADRRAAGRR